jgi:hypothetical protein
MDRVTGSDATDAADPRHGFEAPAGPVTTAWHGQRAIGVAAAVLVIGLVGVVAGLVDRAGRPGQLTADSGQPPVATAEAAAGDRPVAILRDGGAPFALLSTGTATRGQAIVAIPGCEVTLQLDGRQPRRIRQCAERLPRYLGRMLRVEPRQALVFEVPGWRVQGGDRSDLAAPAEAGMWTITVPTCLSRGAEWLCATWYATVEVSG